MEMSINNWLDGGADREKGQWAYRYLVRKKLLTPGQQIPGGVDDQVRRVSEFFLRLELTRDAAISAEKLLKKMDGAWRTEQSRERRKKNEQPLIAVKISKHSGKQLKAYAKAISVSLPEAMELLINNPSQFWEVALKAQIEQQKQEIQRLRSGEKIALAEQKQRIQAASWMDSTRLMTELGSFRQMIMRLQVDVQKLEASIRQQKP